MDLLGVGDWNVDVATGEIADGYCRRRLTPLQLQLLLLLARRSGELVAKEDILDTLWPDT